MLTQFLIHVIIKTVAKRATKKNLKKLKKIQKTC